MRNPMRKDIGKSVEGGTIRVIAGTPQLARGYSGLVPPQQPSEPSSDVERKEGSALRNSEVLDRRNNVTFQRKR